MWPRMRKKTRLGEMIYSQNPEKYFFFNRYIFKRGPVGRRRGRFAKQCCKKKCKRNPGVRQWQKCAQGQDELSMWYENQGFATLWGSFRAGYE